MTVAVLTDSTACLPADMAAESGVRVLPLHVLVGRRTMAEGVDIDAAQVAALLRGGRGAETVSTSRPAPGEFVQAYRDLVEQSGCDAIASLHLSSAVSGTVEAARLAADAVRDEVRVEVLDSRVLGMALGYAACAGAQAAAQGAGVEEVIDLAGRRCAASTTLFYVDTLEHLRRGGRVGTAAAIVGSALSIKPLLAVADGTVQLRERVRTRGKALARLEELCREAATAGRAAAGAVDVAVHHLDWAEQAQGMRDRLAAALPEGTVVDLVELGAVTAVHTGPGTLAVVVAPRV